jgi:hypothetical protein
LKEKGKQRHNGWDMPALKTLKPHLPQIESAFALDIIPSDTLEAIVKPRFL